MIRVLKRPSQVPATYVLVEKQESNLGLHLIWKSIVDKEQEEEKACRTFFHVLIIFFNLKIF